ncbi:hypothetical protein GUH75_22695 [Xanthomonas citri pv. citri]|nr:hypothetical protein [Xanthomonas citri pv. citri]
MNLGIGMGVRLGVSNDVRMQLRRNVRLRITGLFDLIGHLRHLEGLHRFDGVFG